MTAIDGRQRGVIIYESQCELCQSGRSVICCVSICAIESVWQGRSVAPFWQRHRLTLKPRSEPLGLFS
jgi:hypothetical protein